MSDPLAQALLPERIAEKQRRLDQIKVESHNLILLSILKLTLL